MRRALSRGGPRRHSRSASRPARASRTWNEKDHSTPAPCSRHWRTLGAGPALPGPWQKVRADGSLRPELLEAACAVPRLRQLFPWTGMGELHF
ncbi:DUF6193 family natural product biosynthesis protein, partial [Streptomyces sp. NPDC056930]|uniref:DUF6193 family natural product biosynthesis protein n=1 Tax=Streptomyces sp. NPDC056930 TaxID=3345967 RepID=UPI003643B947